MCGIAGIVSYKNVNTLLYEALTVLQHRGQDAAGIATCHHRHFHLRKANGLVRDVFFARHMERLQGDVGIGHVRYPTAGSLDVAEAQPFYTNSPYGIVLAHNGNLINAHELRQRLLYEERRHLNTESDSEILLNVIAYELQMQNIQGGLSADNIFRAIETVHQRCTGGYAAVGMIIGYGLFAFRDPFGIRPLVLGRRNTERGEEYMVASESVALDCAGFELVRDVAPGEAVYIDQNKQLHIQQCAQKTQLSPCLFEYVYMARPDSVMDGVSVYDARVSMGKILADKIQREWFDKQIDVVMPIPDSSRSSALELAHCLNIPYREGFVKNRYIGRTFIMPAQKIRHSAVRRKLNTINAEFQGKNILIVDDSVVRGTTCKQIIEIARESGANKVYFCSAAPAVRYPNVYGIDMPVADELIAHKRTHEEVCEYMKADGLIYQDLDALTQELMKKQHLITQFDSSVFDGHYVTGNINADYLDKLAQKRADGMKTTHNNDEDTLYCDRT
ncbi:MAG: amidophosphoribosyltransferase [Endozoicomonadaceae bacterium]|nr:amidophosphoribosyltransferase [Endozoicomonadaceae bacterium]